MHDLVKLDISVWQEVLEITHIVACVDSLFLLIVEQKSILRVYHHYFDNSPVGILTSM